MRVLVYGKLFPDSFAHNISTTLEHMGHEVVTATDASVKLGMNKLWLPRLKLMNYAEVLFPSLRVRWGENLVALAGDTQPDIILMIEQPHPSIIAGMRDACSAKIVYWMTDALPSFGRQYALAADYDALFFKDQYVVDFVREKLNKRAFFLPQAFNPKWHRRVELTADDRQTFGCDITVAGNMYYYRALMIEPFLEHDVKIWGPNPPKWLVHPVKRFCQGRYVAKEDKARAYGAAKIVLNTMHYSEILGTNLRMFEAAGCGGFQITDWRENLHEVFDPDNELVTFKTRDEMVEKVNYYLEHDDERQAIADRCYARAHREHTFEHRLRDMFSWTFDGHPAEKGAA